MRIESKSSNESCIELLKKAGSKEYEIGETHI